jgi:signal transduction histidine kinase/ActR/RegA family two-component response regulator
MTTPQLLAEAPDCVKVLSSDGIVQFINQQGVLLLEAGSALDIIGKPYRELWPLDMRDAVDRALAGAVAGAQTSIEGAGPTFSGRTRWWEAHFHGVRGVDGTVELIGIARDVTARHDREMELASSQEQLTRDLQDVDRQRMDFIAMLAHELRNPLAPVRTGLQVLKQHGHEPAEMERIRIIMERQVDQMVHLVDGLLDLARLKSGRIELYPTSVDLTEILKSAIDASTMNYERLGVTLTLQSTHQRLLLSGDPTRLVQVFTNLLDNAAKFTPRGGTVVVSVETSVESVDVSITDSGVGIAPDAMPTIFEMFNTGGRQAAGSTGGLGIGLNLVQRLVEMHAGQVSARSAGVGSGSTFVVRLPTSEVSAAGVSAGIVAAAPAAPLRILLVDDNADAMEMWAMLLADDSREIRTAASGPQALEQVRQFKPAIVFLDIGMPEMDGYAVARAIHEIPGTDSTFIVALTGWGSSEDRKRSQAAGFHAHLTKPADLEAIEALLRKVAVGTAD